MKASFQLFVMFVLLYRLSCQEGGKGRADQFDSGRLTVGNQNQLYCTSFYGLCNTENEIWILVVLALLQKAGNFNFINLLNSHTPSFLSLNFPVRKFWLAVIILIQKKERKTKNLESAAQREQQKCPRLKRREALAAQLVRD